MQVLMFLSTLPFLLSISNVDAFIVERFLAETRTPTHCKCSYQSYQSSRLSAAPQRLPENSPGPLYVNEKCINCAACSMFASSVFGRADSTSAHIVQKQPSLPQEIEETRAALRACPVAAIRLENQAFRSHRNMNPLSQREEIIVKELSDKSKVSFPRRVSSNVDGVYFVGHHNSASFGAAPYLVSTKDGWIMIDSPKFSISSVQAVESLTGPQGPSYLLLTHVDDTADHGKWKSQYPLLERIFHGGDLGIHNWIGDTSLEQVEILLDDSRKSPMPFFTLEGIIVDNSSSEVFDHDVLILYTPGHSPGSITIWKLPTSTSNGVLFTGDTYSFTTRDGGHMTGFPRYGNDMKQQAETLSRFLKLDWDFVAPGHGHVKDYSLDNSDPLSIKEIKERDIQDAIRELLTGNI
jgi:glyoxylase-like metal-dependent hydrolase (beta-lactamase superfamily II)/ferredoxin